MPTYVHCNDTSGEVTSFSASGQDGRACDKHSTACEQWALNLLLPRDIALVGRGFDIEEDIARMLVSSEDTNIIFTLD